MSKGKDRKLTTMMIGVLRDLASGQEIHVIEPGAPVYLLNFGDDECETRIASGIIRGLETRGLVTVRQPSHDNRDKSGNVMPGKVWMTEQGKRVYESLRYDPPSGIA